LSSRQFLPSLLPLSRQYLGNENCQVDKRGNYQNCAVLCTAVCPLTYAQCRSRSAFECFCHFVSVLFAFVVLSVVSSVLSQEIGREERLRNDLFYVEWDVKP